MPAADRPTPEEVASSLDTDLPELARSVIRRHLDLGEDANRAFLAHPDDRYQHQHHWHQWGILTHTRVFLRMLDEDVPAYLREWGLWQPVNERLSRPIDGVERWRLLRIAVLLHDIGKFAVRTRGRDSFHFQHHERLSGEIIRHELDLGAVGLTPAQIEYVALTAEDHFVLGLVRKRARDQGEFSLEFTASPAFDALCAQIIAGHPGDAIEIGVLFLGDSLAKVNPPEGPDRALSQYDINIAVARAYLARAVQTPNL